MEPRCSVAVVAPAGFVRAPVGSNVEGEGVGSVGDDQGQLISGVDWLHHHAAEKVNHVVYPNFV